MADNQVMDLSEKGVVRLTTTGVTAKKHPGEAPTAETGQAAEGVAVGSAEGEVDIATCDSSSDDDVVIIDNVITVIEISSDEEDTSANMLPQDENRAVMSGQEGNRGDMFRQRYSPSDILLQIQQLSNINKKKLQRAYDLCLEKICEADEDCRGLSARQVQQLIDQEMNKNSPPSMQPPSPAAALPVPEQVSQMPPLVEQGHIIHECPPASPDQSDEEQQLPAADAARQK